MLKAGIIPYYISNGRIEMLFMISSDPRFGGPDPMISKGHIDEGESPLQCAIREGEEELGLLRSNIREGSIHLISQGLMTGMDDSYIQFTYACQVLSKDAFVKPHYETKETVWMTAEEFARKGRLIHLSLVVETMVKIKG